MWTFNKKVKSLLNSSNHRLSTCHGLATWSCLNSNHRLVHQFSSIRLSKLRPRLLRKLEFLSVKIRIRAHPTIINSIVVILKNSTPWTQMRTQIFTSKFKLNSLETPVWRINHQLAFMWLYIEMMIWFHTPSTPTTSQPSRDTRSSLIWSGSCQSRSMETTPWRHMLRIHVLLSHSWRILELSRLTSMRARKKEITLELGRTTNCMRLLPIISHLSQRLRALWFLSPSVVS